MKRKEFDPCLLMCDFIPTPCSSSQPGVTRGDEEGFQGRFVYGVMMEMSLIHACSCVISFLLLAHHRNQESREEMKKDFKVGSLMEL